MPSYTSEAKLVEAAMRLIRRRGGVVQKIHGGAAGSAGQPDLDAVIAGRPVKVEAKQPGKRPTPIQYRRMREWQDVGALTGWFTSTEELTALLTHLSDTRWRNPQLEVSEIPQPIPVHAGS